MPVAGTLAHSFITSFSGTEVPPDPVSTSSAWLHYTGQDPRTVLALGVGQDSLCSAHRPPGALLGSLQAGGIPPAQTWDWA